MLTAQVASLKGQHMPAVRSVLMVLELPLSSPLPLGGFPSSACSTWAGPPDRQRLLPTLVLLFQGWLRASPFTSAPHPTYCPTLLQALLSLHTICCPSAHRTGPCLTFPSAHTGILLKLVSSIRSFPWPRGNGRYTLLHQLCGGAPCLPSGPDRCPRPLRASHGCPQQPWWSPKRPPFLLLSVHGLPPTPAHPHSLPLLTYTLKHGLKVAF